PHIDQGVRQQFHAEVSLLQEFKTKQQPLEFVLPRKGPIDTRLGRLSFEGVYALSSYAGMTTSNTSSHDLPAANSCLISSSKDRMTSRPIARHSVVYTSSLRIIPPPEKRVSSPMLSQSERRAQHGRRVLRKNSILPLWTSRLAAAIIGGNHG